MTGLTKKQVKKILTILGGEVNDKWKKERLIKAINFILRGRF